MHDKNYVAHFSSLKNLDCILKDDNVQLGPIKFLNDPRENSLDWISLQGIGETICTRTSSLWSGHIKCKLVGDISTNIGMTSIIGQGYYTVS
jgi:hypothetical protein